ncbi:Transcription regulator [Lactobacillus plantarum subsp. plantarum P-8] [Lactiplantibacillus mudanjiangensis]|uniref:helix-turn-helix domain-containing protein n=1 Tax=Lactiplantibacillus mudanjiangensis TaxID=1296538 RepID=UPI001014B944|nr:helix-turn-helix transcriptional regulator [Lactiplantibacillus mudanjiangensis]VDG33816.1 Transcription regulator [Lactobacillus plantarum subsp. plantarum P-8] [Lactiplantibacillus mudanjiangensis]
MKFAENLKVLRQQRQLTQAQVAEQLQVSRKTISSWETERSYPDLGMLIEISNQYELSLDQLLKGDLTMIKTYDQQAKVSRRNDQIVTVSYYLNVVCLFITYLVKFAHWQRYFQGNVDMVLNLIFVVNLGILVTLYHGYDHWAATNTQAVRLLVALTMLTILNVALNLPLDLTGAVTGAYAAGEMAGYATGVMFHVGMLIISGLMILFAKPRSLK